MKNLIMVGGTMGAGKTTVCSELTKLLPNNVFLDGDWCWKATPFIVNEETKEMVMENITYMLAQFLNCSAYQNVIFCWVMDHQEIIDELLSRLEEQADADFSLYNISLTLSSEALKERLQKDIQAGIRQPDILERASERLTLFESLNTKKIDVSDCTPADAAKKIAGNILSASFDEN